MKDYVCGIDLGTSALKVSFVAQDGTLLGPFRREIHTYSPQPFYAEQEPDQWYELLREVLAEALATGLVDKYHIKAILPSAATHTVVLLDANFRPVRRAIMWNDQRSAALAAGFKEAEEVFRLTNHRPGAMWSLFQNLWVKQYEPDVWHKVNYMMFAKDYLRFRLTGEYCTDYIDAEGSQLYDVREKRWSERLCGFLGFPPNQLPPLRQPTDLAGRLTPRAAEDLGLLAGTPVYVGTTDTALEIVAVGALSQGQATVKLATSGRICVITDRPYPHELLVNYRHVVDGLYYVGTGTRSCTSSLRWFKDRFLRAEMWQAEKEKRNVYALLDEEAAKVPPGAERLFFHPYLLGEFTPYADDKLRASFIGITMKHTYGHFARAIMEGAAYSLRDSMRILKELGLKITAAHLIVLGGGSTSPLWRGILADVLNQPLAVPRYSDSSLGGAMLAGVAEGMFNSLEEAFRICNRIIDFTIPDPDNVATYDKLFPLYTEIVTRLQPIYEKMG